jgi:catechol 2,3-dioxygenase-like lactoylglutathione lyase family enzyme
MKRAVKGLDHVVVMVDGIDAAEAAYRRLGFQVQPRGFHQKLGTANHLMIFERDYFEILGIVEPTEFNAERREWLKQGGGLANVALATDGADVAFDAFKSAGLNPDAPLFFDRAVEIDSKTERAQFRTVRIPKTNMPVVGFFVCEHLASP